MKRIMRYNLYVDPADEAACARELQGVKILEQVPPSPPGSAFRRKTVMFRLKFERSLWPEVQRVRDTYDRAVSCEGKPAAPKEECVFTEKELDTAELLELEINRSPLIAPGVQEGMEFDWTAEPTEGNPAPWCWQHTPRLMNKKDLPKPQVAVHWTQHREILIHRRLLDVVPGFKCEHLKLGEVIAAGEVSDWVQLMADRVMPPYHAATTGIQIYLMEYAPPSSPPTFVGKMEEGYWPAYRRAEVLERFGRIPTAAFSWELSGHWGVGIGYSPEPGDLTYQNAPPQPGLMVDQQTRRELKAAGVTRLRYVPVRWAD